MRRCGTLRTWSETAQTSAHRSRAWTWRITQQVRRCTEGRRLVKESGCVGWTNEHSKTLNGATNKNTPSTQSE